MSAKQNDTDTSADAHPASIFSLTNHEIWVLTAHHEGRDNGQVATWIMPATLVPDRPRIVAVLSPQNLTHDLIALSGRFVLNLLAEDQADLLPHFGLASGRQVDKFAGDEPRRSPEGIPVLDGCCGWAECRIVSSLDIGDRIVYVADILAQEIHPGMTPLRKKEAFAAQPQDVRRQLEEKHRVDGERDRIFIKTFTD
ncbi:MAG: flavin reductase family protein [Bacteroidota bacterium]|nr:flavin reductase family protein [Bacteroidota bacterium]